jgi:hypothetical protein
VDPTTRPTGATDSRKRRKADSPPSTDSAAHSGSSEPDAPARTTALFRAKPVTTAEVPTSGPVKRKKTRCRQARDQRKWSECINRIKARRACPDSPGAAQGAPSPLQAVGSIEKEPDASPAHPRPLAHRVTTRPDPPTQDTLERLGLSEPTTAPDPDLCVETEHRLPVPRPVYMLYRSLAGPMLATSTPGARTLVRCLTQHPHGQRRNLVP